MYVTFKDLIDILVDIGTLMVSLINLYIITRKK